MATTYITSQESPKYSANLLPRFAEFNENITWNVVEGGSNAVAENDISRSYQGDRSLLFTFTDTGGITIDYTDGLKFVAPKDGYYIISMRMYVRSTDDDATINSRIYMYINGVNTSATDFNMETTYSGFEYDAWNTFTQTLYLEQGDEVDSQIKAQSTKLGSKVWLDGFKIEFDDRGLGIPSRYTQATDKQLFQFSFDYNDSGTPIAYTSGNVVLSNDGAGAFTNTDFIPIENIGIYSVLNDEFSFGSLELGDAVFIRLDIDVTTTANNQVINTYIELGESGSEYKVYFSPHQIFKSIGTYENITVERRITMLNSETLNNVGRIYFNSDNNATVVVNGFNVTVLTKK